MRTRWVAASVLVGTLAGSALGYLTATALADEPEPHRSSGTPAPGGSGVGALTYSLVVTDPTVPAGGELHYVLVVRNDSDRSIVVPDCVTAVGGRGLVKEDQPGAELWTNVAVDCGGPQVISAGEVVAWTETAYARNRYGDPYEVGPHLLGRELPGARGRLLVPVEVVAAD